MYPFASLERSGALLAAGSDYPFTPLDPFEAIEVGLTRRDPRDSSSPPLGEDEALTLETLLAAYTINAAYQLHQEDRTGSIEPGKLADLIVIDRNLFETPTESISETGVLLTLLEGEVVHRAHRRDGDIR
jgi:predicted amidohydrolase YtcJ